MCQLWKYHSLSCIAIFKAKMQNICCVLLLKHEDFPLSSLFSAFYTQIKKNKWKKISRLNDHEKGTISGTDSYLLITLTLLAGQQVQCMWFGMLLKCRLHAKFTVLMSLLLFEMACNSLNIDNYQWKHRQDRSVNCSTMIGKSNLFKIGRLSSTEYNPLSFDLWAFTVV